MVLLCAILLDTRRIYTMASASRTLILSIVISQALICPAFPNMGKQAALAFGNQTSEEKSADQAIKAEKTDKGDKAKKATKTEKAEKTAKADKPEQATKADKPEKKEKKEKKVELSEEDIEAEKAYAEHQAKLQALLKEVKTPFGNQSEVEEQKTDPTAPMTLPATARQRLGRSLSDRLLASRLYLPGRLVIGHPAEFTIKGRPGHWVALAMADRDSGAKPINGHKIRLGPDRKVIALGKIPESGVLPLKIYAPVAGDLIGQNLYFEAAIWNENDLSHVEFAQTITSETQNNGSSSTRNAVLVAAEGDHKRGVRIVPDSAVPMYQRANMSGVTLDSGKP